MSATLDEAGESLWLATLDGWADPAAHDRFVGHCFATTQLAAAAARYRARLAEAPGDEIARQMMARIAFLATQALRPTPAPGPPLSRSPVFLIVIATGAVAGALLGLLYRARR
jgi:hypothetical protein